MKKILVIDDLPENVYLLQNILESENYNVITAYDGKSGTQKAIIEKPDLILLDILMPDVTGIEVCRALFAKSETASIPIILITAKDDAEDTKEGLEAGAFDYIKKPISRMELLARVNSALKLSEIHQMISEIEKDDTFSATVVTTNHKIKQPLTLISLICTSIRREIGKEIISREVILSKLDYVEKAVNDINDVLNKMHAIKKPSFSEYIRNIKMIDIDNKEV
jgi:DNA-binding response OmpR family regulator